VKPLLGVVLVLGVGSAATATTVALRQEPSLGISQERRLPGPDSARVAGLLSTLGNVDPVMCEMIADQIGNFWWSDGGVGVGQLDDTRVAVRAAKDSVSGPVSDARAIRLLGATLGHDDPCVRLVAAKMLGNSSADDATIGAPLGASSARVREAGLRAAGERDRPALRARVERMLGDEPAVAAMAAWALGEFEQRESVGALRKQLSNGAPRVRVAAAWALGQIEDPAAAEDLARALDASGSDIALAIAAAEALQNLDLEDQGPPPAALVRAVESSDARLRYAALQALFDFEDEALIPVFLRFIRDPEAEIRMQAIQSLGSMGAVAAVPAITRALEDPDPEVRRAAVEALAEIEDR
jgi:HEAT repeats